VLARPWARLLGARLDPALPLQPGMVEVLEPLVLHHEVSTNRTESMLAGYLETWQRTGSRAQASEAAWRIRDELAAEATFVARGYAPAADLPDVLDDPRLGRVEVLVGVEHDPVEILLAGIKCLDPGYGVRREHTQDTLDQPTVLLRIWLRTEDDTRGAPVAALYAGVFDQLAPVRGKTILPLSHPFDERGPRGGAVFNRYLRHWARQRHTEQESWTVGYPEFFWAEEGAPQRTGLPVPSAGVLTESRIAMPGDSPRGYYAEVFQEPISVPRVHTFPLRLWHPDTPPGQAHPAEEDR
jgi:hypothetical protein